MYKIPILKSANAIFSKGMAVQAIVLNIKLKIRVKNNQVGIGW
jgi:hypothetical protein